MGLEDQIVKLISKRNELGLPSLKLDLKNQNLNNECFN